jgi:predicted site-specific integrase-resolvase
MKLSEYAKLKGVCYRTAWNWFQNGKIPNSEQMDNGTIIVNTKIKIEKAQDVVLYARVSHNKEKPNLIIQLNRLRDFANANGYIIKKEFKEISSGSNENRVILNKILNNQDYKTIMVETEDILAENGFHYIKSLLELQDRFILVINENKSNN